MASELSNLVRGDSYRMATSGRATQSKLLNKPQKEDLNDLKQELDMDAHRILIDDLYYLLGADPEEGLSNEEAKSRLKANGSNVLSPIHSTPAWVIFFKNLFSGFSLLLWIGGILCFIAFGIQAGAYANPPMDNLWLGLVLIVIVLLSATFTFYQETKSSKIMESFERLVPYRANVVRNGFTYDILAEDLVVGDIINVKGGDRIPADIRIISANSFKVDNSSLTGESEAQVRSTEYTNENSLETKNLAFFSTYAVEGSCRGVVINTADGTVMGRIANLASGLEATMTPIAKEIEFFIRVITVMSVILALIFIIAAFLLGYYWIDSILFLIAIIIACVPEGLLATVMVCLTLTAKRMAKKNCLVKHLEAVETLGCTKVICCDKTGTLTQNKMTVSHIWFDNYIIEIELADNELLNGFDTDAPTWLDLARATMLCNHSKFLPSEEEGQSIMQKNCSGDASEAALLRFMEVVHGNVEEFKNKNRNVFEIPFNSQNKYQISVHETDDQQNEYLLVMKGAPEKVLEYCDSVMMDGQPFAINDDWRSSFMTNYERLGVMGERVIGFAQKRLGADKFPRGFDFQEEEYKMPPAQMQFIGLVSMVDPPRSSVPDAVEKCRTAGIKVVMITGDHPVTAKAVAKAVGIISEGRKTVEDLAIERGISVVDVDPSDAKACVIHGNDLRHMTPDQLDAVLKHHEEIVFARTTPHQKLLIVEGFQRLGHIVAVTGDGVNDSPALKKADIGIAMGVSGSDVSKQAADMILLDDNFASIVTGIEEGRIIFDNLKKSICYTLTSNIPEIAPFLLFIVAGIPLPLGTIAVLLIDLGTDILPAISLAYEKAETDNMKRDPRNPKTDRLITHNLLARAYAQIGIIEAAAAFFTYFIIMAECGFWPLRLFGLRQEWDSLAINDVMDSYGQEWSYRQRKQLEYTSAAGFFVAIVMTQWANLIVCKTKRNSVFEEGLRNHYLTGSLFISATLAIIFVYTPGLDIALRLQPLRFTWFLPALPFLLLIIIYDEIRKYIGRNGCKTYRRETLSD